MAGSFSDQATLSTDNAFIAKVKVAMIFRATQNYTSETAQTWRTLQQAHDILANAASNAPSIAALVATGNASIAAAAPAVPNDADTQFAVNTVLTSLL